VSGPGSTDALRSNADTRSDVYRENRAGFLERIGQLNEQLALAREGGGAKYVQRHLARGKLMARERVELLLDRDSCFLELSPLAAWAASPRFGGDP
jgi:acetyl-CoA carboxylase carboxyltransferase component